MAHIKTIAVLNEQMDKMKERLTIYEPLPAFGNEEDAPLTSRPSSSSRKVQEELETKQKIIEVNYILPALTVRIWSGRLPYLPDLRKQKSKSIDRS